MSSGHLTSKLVSRELSSNTAVKYTLTLSSKRHTSHSTPPPPHLARNSLRCVHPTPIHAPQKAIPARDGHLKPHLQAPHAHPLVWDRRGGTSQCVTHWPAPRDDIGPREHAQHRSSVIGHRSPRLALRRFSQSTSSSSSHTRCLRREISLRSGAFVARTATTEPGKGWG